MEAFLKEIQHLKIQLEEIKLATNNFDKNNVIGGGGYGSVYKGVLSQSQGQIWAAFKRLNPKFGQGNIEFLKEIQTLTRYTHENLISLLGFCNEDGEKILVYEHAYHGSLDRHLSSTTLGWWKRLKICLGAAKGLCYLHDPKGAEQRVIHCDIKSSNILLDASWNAKVSDMGLSKIGPANQQHSFLVTTVVGTFGYTDPVYMHTNSLTKESDVYSFGMVLFEVMCGRLCYDYRNNQSLWHMWKEKYQEKKLDEIIFQDLKQQMSPRSLETFSNIAFKCLHISREQRPNMSIVVEELESAIHFQKTDGPVEYEEMSETMVCPHLVYESKEERQMRFYRGMLINEGKRWLSLNKNGEHYEMIPAAECLVPILPAASPSDAYLGTLKKSRFPANSKTPLYWIFKMHVKAQFLSPHITYTVNLVYNRRYHRNVDKIG